MFRTGDGRLWADSSERARNGLCSEAARSKTSARGSSRAGYRRSPDADEIVVSEFALYQLGMRDDADLEKAIGRTVKLDVGGVSQRPTARAGPRADRPPPAGRTDPRADARTGKADPFAAGKDRRLRPERGGEGRASKTARTAVRPAGRAGTESGKTASGHFRTSAAWCGCSRARTARR